MKGRLQKQFDEFHRTNPHVYALFARFTREVMERGYKRFSSDAIVQRIRWETSVVTTTLPVLKIGNNHAAYYAREWTKNNPAHAGFFRLNELRSEEIDIFA